MGNLPMALAIKSNIVEENDDRAGFQYDWEQFRPICYS